MTDAPNPTLDAILARRRRRRTLSMVLGAGLALAVAGTLFWLREPDEAVETSSRPTPPPAASPRDAIPAESAPAPATAATPTSPAPPARPLPPLAESDSRVRELAARWSSRPELLAWLASDELIRRIVAAVDSTARGESAADQAPPAMRPKGRFEVVASGSAYVAAPSSPARYDLLTEIVTGLDGDALVLAYHELRPLFEEAHRDLGSPIRSFDAALRQAIAELLSVPHLTEPPLLEPLLPGYGYVDPALEALSPAQKQLLRFGPANVARIQQKVRELALRLGIPESDLPAANRPTAGEEADRG